MSDIYGKHNANHFDENSGHGILKSISEAHRFLSWTVEVIEPYLGRKILEVGSGIGNVSQYISKRERLILTDIDPIYLDILRSNFSNIENISITKLDLNDDLDFTALGDGVVDTIICLNVLEHIEYDVAALKRMSKLLVPGGHIILLVPQYEFLFGSFDSIVEHYRRYTKHALKKTVISSGLIPIKFINFNFLPIFGWWLNGVVLKRKQMDHWQIKIFDMLVPLLKFIERILPLPGLSLICIAEKKSTSLE